MSIISSPIIIAIMMCCCIKLPASDITLSSGGKTSYRIAVKQSAIPAEVTAANELAKYLNAVSASTFKIVEENKIALSDKAIYVGQTKYAAAHGVDFNKLGREEWIIKTTDDGNLILSGGRPRGTLYAVYEFLETNIGCHWLDKSNEIIPSVSLLKISSLNIQGKPYFRNRQIFDLLDWYPVFQTFKTRNKGTSYNGANQGWSFKIGRPRQHHTFYNYSESWPKNKSELHSLDSDGKRLIAINPVGPGQICMTNPEARRLVLSKLKEFIAQDRKEAAAEAAKGYQAPIVYDISQNDNENKCVCKNCKKIADREGSYSGPLLDFINYIAANIKKDYPDVYIRTFAYGYSIKPPKFMKAADNVIIQLASLGVEFGSDKGARDTMRKLNSPFNKLTYNLIKNWSKKAANLAIWDYWVLYPTNPEPYVNVSRLQTDMAFYKAKNVKDVFTENENPHCTSFFGLKCYLGYKLMQNPDQPDQPIIDEFMKGYYGKAAPIMKKLLSYMEKRQNENNGPIGKVDVSRRRYLDLDYFKTTLGLLDHAEKLVAGNTKLLANIRRERIPILAGLFMRWLNLKGVSKKFNGPELIKQFKIESIAAINYYYPNPDPKKFRDNFLGDLEKFVKIYKNRIIPIKIPAQFKNKKIVDLPWACFRLDIGNSKLIEDKEAVGGKTIVLGKDVLDKVKVDSTILRVFDWNANKTLCITEMTKSNIAQDEKYHILKIGRVNFVNDSHAFFYVGSPTGIRCSLDRIFPLKSSYDVYVSIKFSGPKYVSGSTKENSIMVDRIIFAVPDKPVSPKLPALFKNRKVIDLQWSRFQLIGHAKLIKDPEASGGKTVILGAKALNKTQNGRTSFGIYDSNKKKVLCSREVKTSSIAKDEKYHILEIGQVNFDKDSRTYFYGGSSWEIHCSLPRLFSKKSSYKLYVSVKFQGPEYVPGSTKENSIMVDRIFFAE